MALLFNSWRQEHFWSHCSPIMSFVWHKQSDRVFTKILLKKQHHYYTLSSSYFNAEHLWFQPIKLRYLH
jgi:hypothetical protein